MKVTPWVRLMAKEDGKGGGGGTPPAPPAPAPAGAAAPLKIPSMKEIQGAPPAEPKPSDPPPAVVPKPGDPPPVVAPAPGAAEDDVVIPTDIVTPIGKTPEQFAAERRQQKQTRMDAGQLETQYQQATALLQQREAEIEQLKAEREKLATEKADFERLAQTREGEINGFKSTWASTNRVTYNPGDDETVRNADASMKRAMQERLPLTVPGQQTDAEGKPVVERVFAEVVLNDSAEQERLHGVLAHYANARHHRNNGAIDLAVNMMAQVLGANVKLEGTDPAQWKTLPRGDATFQAIESAMAAALPSFQQKVSRLAEIQKDGPKFALEAFGKRADSIRTNLASGIFLDAANIQRRLQTNPHDPVALFAAIVSQAPDLKTESEALLGRFANSFATVGDQLIVPTLRGNRPEDVEAHMQEVNTHRNQLADIMRYAVVGANSGKIIAQLIAERDAAEERAGKAARAENPGSPAGAGGMGGPTGGDVDIPTKIVT